MKLSHSGDDRLAGFFVDACPKSRIFLCKSLQSFSDIGLSLLVLCLDAEVNHRIGHVHRGHRVSDTFGGKRVTRGAVDTEEADNVAGAGILDVLHFVRVHSYQAADTDITTGAA